MGRGAIPRRLVLGLVLAMGAALLPLAVDSPAAADVPSDANPPIEQSCGLDVTLVLDASGSVSSSHAVEDVRDAGSTLLDALTNTNSTARVTQFASLSEQLAPRTGIDDAALERDGALGQAVTDYYNPIPPRPGQVTIESYDGSGNAQNDSNYRTSNGSNQYTNWDQGLDQAGSDPGELVIFVTDGDPTGFDFDRSADPFDQGPPPDVAVNTNRSEANTVTMDRAVQGANGIKASGARVLTIGVGSALNSSSSVGRLQRISGPQVVRDDDLADVDDLNQIDVALITEFEDLSQFMRSLVLQLCSPSLTVRKLAQTAGDAAYTPRQGWDITVTPEVPGGSGFDWILPDTAPATSKTQATNATGFAQFQWEPDPPEADSRATVAEAVEADHTPGRPGSGNDYRCEARNEFGDVREITGDFTDPANPSFLLDPVEQEIVTCTVWNSFDYAPAIALSKTNAPGRVRGDLSPPAVVTSSYVATNPGNTPLDVAGVTDDQCGPVTPVPATGDNAGDANGDGRLDPGEAWQFACDRVIVSPLTTDPPENILNTAEVQGTAPDGQVVTAGADDDVDVFTPAIELVKTVNGAEQAALVLGGTASYRYEATNTGNMPLGSIDLADDTPPCTAPARGADSPGDDDGLLEVGETWVWTCEAQPEQDVVNTATVTGTPLDPADQTTTFPPLVSDVALASVVVENPDLDLTKSVTPTRVLLRPGDPPAPVTYTFTASNTGTDPLARPGGGDPLADGWIEDGRCTSPAAYVSGDVDSDGVFDDGEAWQFTCPGTVATPTINLARITGIPADDAGDPLPDADPLSDLAAALVQVDRPAISITKTALRPVVLDPDADAFEGPDVPTRREAEYLYEVTNPGTVALSLAASPPADSKCDPVTFTGGDTDDDTLLDPGEVWDYSCATTLQREDADIPPGDGSAVVTNLVDVTGIPFFEGALVPDAPVSASADSDVLVIEPGLQLTKTASTDVVRAGGTVEYTLAVANTGDVDLTPTSLADDTCAPLVFRGGDADDDGRIDGADSTPETWTFTCSRAVPAPPPPADEDVNTATVTAVDPLGNGYRSTDDATVRVVTPAIQLVKTARKQLVPSGTPVTFDFDVTNIGSSAIAAEDVLDQLRLVDAARPGLPECRRPGLVAKEGGNQDDRLDRDPAETWHYECTAPIRQLTVNVAVVGARGGEPVGLTFPVADFDVASVAAFHPGIEVVKTASPTRVEGSGDVTYTYQVRNTGDVPLAGVADQITDDTCSPVEYVAGDLDEDGLLDTPDSLFEDEADEVWTFECTTRVDESTVNTVVVAGSPSGPAGGPLCGPEVDPAVLVVEPCDVTGRDRARVVVTEPPVEPPGGTDGGVDPDTQGVPGLPDTGAGRWLLVILLLGTACVATGAWLTRAGVLERRRSLAAWS